MFYKFEIIYWNKRIFGIYPEGMEQLISVKGKMLLLLTLLTKEPKKLT